MEARAQYVTNLKSLFLPAAVIGVASCGYLCLRGWSVSDAINATKRNVNNAAARVGKQVDSLLSSVILSITKRQLAMQPISRLDLQNRSLEDIIAVSNDFGAQVGVVRREIAQLGLEMRDVNKLIEGWEGKINEVAKKLELANLGTLLLCRFVLQRLEGGRR